MAREGPDVRAEVEVQLLSGYVDAGFSGEMPDVRAVGRHRMSGLAGRAGCPGWARCPGHGRMSGCCSFSSSVFFRRRFQASLADGVVVHLHSHSSSPYVVFRQYLCMHMGEVSSSIPSSKGSSEHV